MLVLANISLVNVPLADATVAAARAGFDGMSVGARPYWYAVERAGFTAATLRELAETHGVAITDVEAAGDWLAPAPEGTPKGSASAYTTAELLVIASELGAETLVAVHLGEAQPLDASAAAFARLCDDAAESGLRVALEFPAWMGIGSLAAAWDVVRAADRPNGGLLVDLWHHRRSSDGDDLLRTIPADRIYSVQLSDATAQPRGALQEDVQHRLFPGQGDFDVVGFVRTLAEMGVDAPLGIEVFDAELVARGVDVAAQELYRSLRDTVDAARA